MIVVKTSKINLQGQVKLDFERMSNKFEGTLSIDQVSV